MRAGRLSRSRAIRISNNKALRNVEPDPQDAPVVKRIFELYASGAHSLKSAKQTVRNETGRAISKANLHLILKNRFYVGFFQWGGQTYAGKHETFLSHDLFQRVQEELAGHNRPRYAKHTMAFRGLMTCAYDGCNVTAEIKKGKYIYYRCTGHRGKCDLPRFTEARIGERLGALLDRIHVPDDVLQQLTIALDSEQERIANETSVRTLRIEQRLAAVRGLMDRSYEDKLNGTIPEDFWQRKMTEWREQESELLFQLNAGQQSNVAEERLTAQRCLELANRASLLYKTQSTTEKAKLLRIVLSNCSIDNVSVTPTYRYPFNHIFPRAKSEEWSGRLDSN